MITKTSIQAGLIKLDTIVEDEFLTKKKLEDNLADGFNYELILLNEGFFMNDYGLNLEFDYGDTSSDFLWLPKVLPMYGKIKFKQDLNKALHLILDYMGESDFVSDYKYSELENYLLEEM